ncbi:putative B3 domain-containing protein Os03g0621600 isoform X2 [Arachis ipaensis]|uniref:putative B3 domain-containing protein Os03g0621600 isoform X2 n=1 Tax=Arachis ipaensis TaxID=130454 RepID=UPI000A2B2945|nr:putative B3 domain-containing protein Os03g0621600 isoform X2 [Arachis ipaensis]
MDSSTFQQNHHSPSTVIRFFKIVLTKSLQHKTLKVPNKFSKKYGNGFPNPVYLKPADDTEWKIDWTNKDGEILFEKGWKEFAAYYSLENGHLLWFEYNGTSKIEVQIFDMSCLEIEYPSNDLINDGNLAGILNEQPQPKKKAKAAPKPSSPSRSKRVKFTVKTIDVEDSEEDSELDSQSKETQLKKLPYVDDFYPGTSGFQALNEAQKFKSENPFFIVKARQSNVSRPTVNFQASFFRKYFEKEQNVQIRFQKILIPAKLRCYPYNSHAIIASGWGLFVRTSTLQPGDVTIFELIEREDPVLDVHIYRAQDFQPQVSGIQSQKEAKKSKCPKEFKNSESQNPSFVIKITESDLSKSRASVPVSFFNKYFEKKEPYVVIRFDSKLWPVKLLCYQANAYISRGWLAFALDNNLKAGDVCILELVNGKDALLECRIYRADG